MREIVIECGAIAVRAHLLDTPTAAIVWRALPLFSVAEVWGREVHFDVPLETYAEPDARMLVKRGEIAFLPDSDTISVAFGPTPISRPGEIRLWSLGNIFAHAIDDVGRLKAVHVGAQIGMRRASEAPSDVLTAGYVTRRGRGRR
jgi:hypothetical protein